MQAEKDILSILEVLKYNEKAFTANTLAKAAYVDSKFTGKFLLALEEIKFIKLIKSPSGRLINYKLDPFSTEIYYIGIECIIKKGHTYHGRYRAARTIDEDDEYKRAREEFPDEARRENVVLVFHRLKPEVLAKEVLKVMGLAEPVEVVEDTLAPYPLVKARFEKYLAEHQRLKSEIDEEEKTNLNNKKWFEEETQKARKGERFKHQPFKTGVITGYMTVSKKVRGNAIFDDDDKWLDKKVPEYEFGYKKVADFPKERDYSYKYKKANVPEMEQLERWMNSLKEYPMKYENNFSAEAEKQAKLTELNKKKQELDSEIKRLKFR